MAQNSNHFCLEFNFSSNFELIQNFRTKKVSLLRILTRDRFSSRNLTRNWGTELYGLDNISPFSICRTVGRHAGDHHGSPFPNRVLCEDISEHIYRHISLSVNSFFTKPLLFINNLILVKVKYFSF